MSLILAALSIEAIIKAVIVLIVLGLVFWILYWLIGVIAPPEPFRKIATVVLAIAAALVCIAMLMSLIGHPIVDWN